MRPKKIILLAAPLEAMFDVQAFRLGTWGLRVVAAEAWGPPLPLDAVLCDGVSHAEIEALAQLHPAVPFVVMVNGVPSDSTLQRAALDGTRSVFTVSRLLKNDGVLLREAMRMALARRRGPKKPPQPVTACHQMAGAA